LWAFAVLVVAIVQLPPWLVLAPIVVWVFSVAEPVPATIFAVYMLIVSLADMVLKPMLLGRGVETPMLVILVGAIGGAMTLGIIGLFLGAVILAVSYELLVAWMAPDEDAVDA
jgi:predicted PurR-regulated permease PerM